MVRLGKWSEGKVAFRDTLTGKRGIQWSTNKKDGLYRLCWFGRVVIPHKAVSASNIGGRGEYGKTYGGRILGATGVAIIARHTGTYATTLWSHGIDNVVGCFAMGRQSGAAGFTNQATAIGASIINSSTIRVNIEGYTAGSVAINLFVFGATTLAYP